MDLMDALAELPGTAQQIAVTAAPVAPFTRRRLPGAIVELPARQPDAPLFPDHDDPGFEGWFAEGLASAIGSRNVAAVKWILGLGLASGLR